MNTCVDVCVCVLSCVTRVFVCLCRWWWFRFRQWSLSAGGRSERLVRLHTLVRQWRRRRRHPAGGMLGKSGRQRQQETSRYQTSELKWNSWFCYHVSLTPEPSVCQMLECGRVRQLTGVWRWRRCLKLAQTEQRLMGQKTCCCCQTSAHTRTEVWTRIMTSSWSHDHMLTTHHWSAGILKKKQLSPIAERNAINRIHNQLSVSPPGSASSRGPSSGEGRRGGAKQDGLNAASVSVKTLDNDSSESEWVNKSQHTHSQLNKCELIINTVYLTHCLLHVHVQVYKFRISLE